MLVGLRSQAIVRAKAYALILAGASGCGTAIMACARADFEGLPFEILELTLEFCSRAYVQTVLERSLRMNDVHRMSVVERGGAVPLGCPDGPSCAKVAWLLLECYLNLADVCADGKRLATNVPQLTAFQSDGSTRRESSGSSAAAAFEIPRYCRMLKQWQRRRCGIILIQG